jgi:hypothetical protein
MGRVKKLRFFPTTLLKAACCGFEAVENCLINHAIQDTPTVILKVSHKLFQQLILRYP